MRKIIGIAITLSLVTCMSVVSFGAETTEKVTVASESAIVSDMNFTGAAIKLSIFDAIKLMQTTGTSAETAELNKKSDEAIAKGYSENIKYSENKSLNEKINIIRRDFAKTQAAGNYESEMNKIESATVQKYYGVLQAQEALRIAKDNLIVQNDILSNTQKKFSLGVVAKKDVLSAETAQISAQNDLASAETMLKSARMELNFLLGNTLMQDVTFSDTLKQVTPPAIGLYDAIVNALKNRNEIEGTNYALDIQNTMLDSYAARYPSNSATYMKQKVAVLEAEKGCRDALVQIQMEIRVKYMQLQDKANAISGAEATLNYAKEGYRLAELSYDAGMTTLTDVQQAQIAVYQAGQLLTAKIVDYDLAVYEYKYAQGVGTTSIAF